MQVPKVNSLQRALKPVVRNVSKDAKSVNNATSKMLKAKFNALPKVAELEYDFVKAQKPLNADPTREIIGSPCGEFEPYGGFVC